MTPKSYITLTAIAIIYVIMATVAVLSPHGNRFAAFADTSASSDVTESEQISYEDVIHITFASSESGLYVPLPLDGMKTFSSVKVTINDNGTERPFTAANFKSLADWSGLHYNSDWVVFKGGSGTILAIRTVDLQKNDNAYIIYADENGEPLDENTYGNFCLYVREGSRNGFFTNIDIVDFG